MDNRIFDVLSQNPDNYIAPFLWLHNEDDEKIVAELEKIYESGIRAVCLESRTHEEFCNADWWSDCRLIFDFCATHGMKAWILDDKHFPSGYANGYIAQHREYAQWNITERHMDVPGPVTEGCALADVWREAEDEEILAVFACEHIPDSKVLTGNIIDLSGNLKDGNVYFDLPEGMWRIVFLIKAQSVLKDRTLQYCDKLNPEATRVYIREVYDKHYENLGEYFGNVFAGFFSDEPGFRNNHNNPFTVLGEIFTYYPWHESVAKHFEKLYGTNGMRNLLALWFEFRDIGHEEYRVAYMDYITHSYHDNFPAMLADWCHEHGVEYIGHVIEDNNIHARTAYGAGHYFRALSPQDMSGIDVVLHQIMPGLTECANSGFVSYKEMENRFFNYCLAKLGSSLAHYQPHMKGRAMCEIFGAFGWAEGTKFMKYLLDHMLVRGINFYVPHAFSPLSDPNDVPPTFYLGGRNPQYPYFRLLMEYTNRMCHMLSGGVHINTCAILYDAENHWTRTARTPLEDIAKLLYDNQLDYDILPCEAVESIGRDNMLGNEQYKLILVPYAEYMPCRIRDSLKKANTRVVVVSDRRDEEFETVNPDELCGFMHANGYVDVVTDGRYPNLRYLHYVRGGAHIYMFSNEDINNTVCADVRLGAFDGGEYILYRGFENKAEKVKSIDGNVKICLAPYNSVLVIFGDVSDDQVEWEMKKNIVSSITPSCSYEIHLREADADSFSPYKTTGNLFSINGRHGVPDFAGDIRYQTHITVPESGNYILDLGNVGETACVKINGKDAGTRIFPPYRFDISEFVVQGSNELEITVTNNAAYKFRDRFSKYVLLEPTGLIGPVKLEQYK
ncbi:MAG: hypothetical protein E7588_03180 [Ruminococcaceae bacterium]|nr:hypothetical protein [Oscillospiraceae bacterium]